MPDLTIDLNRESSFSFLFACCLVPPRPPLPALSCQGEGKGFQPCISALLLVDFAFVYISLNCVDLLIDYILLAEIEQRISID